MIRPVDRVVRLSYIVILATLILVAVYELGTPTLTILFSSLLLRYLAIVFKRKWLAATAFVILVLTIFEGFIVFLRHAVEVLPHVVNTSLPAVVEFARSQGFELPFSDPDSLRGTAMESVRDELGYLANFAKIATKEFVYLIIGFVVAISLFVSKKVDFGEVETTENNLYSLLSSELVERFTLFYRSFQTVIGAQIVISSINTFFTAIFVLWSGIPHAMLIIVITFICGLLPIIGNLISNTFIVCIGITVSPKMAIAALVFLVILHKFEYFLNSKIIGTRIKNPMWLTLLALLLGELVMGIPGMILAPVILHYVKLETSRITIPDTTPAA